MLDTQLTTLVAIVCFSVIGFVVGFRVAEASGPTWRRKYETLDGLCCGLLEAWEGGGLFDVSEWVAGIRDHVGRGAGP